MIAETDPFAKLASLFGRAWFPYPSPIESDRIRALAIRGMEEPSRLTDLEVLELASSVATFHRRKTKTVGMTPMCVPADAADVSLPALD